MGMENASGPRFTVQVIGKDIAYINDALFEDVARVVSTQLTGESVSVVAERLADRLNRSNGALHTLED
jgi:hypothetical protein